MGSEMCIRDSQNSVKEKLPVFSFVKGKSNSTDPSKNIPQFMIQFPLTGETSTTNFSHFNAFPGSSKINRSKSCNYIGNLNDDPKASIVAASGCMHLEQPNQKETKYGSNKNKMYFTMLSNKSPAKFH